MGLGFGAGNSGELAALAFFDEIVAPAAVRFKPDLILVRQERPHDNALQASSRSGLRHCAPQLSCSLV